MKFIIFVVLINIAGVHLILCIIVIFYPRRFHHFFGIFLRVLNGKIIIITR